jgi:hypothetical protein
MGRPTDCQLPARMRQSWHPEGMDITVLPHPAKTATSARSSSSQHAATPPFEREVDNGSEGNQLSIRHAERRSG